VPILYSHEEFCFANQTLVNQITKAIAKEIVDDAFKLGASQYCHALSWAPK
jgi:hypothetical protein